MMNSSEKTFNSNPNPKLYANCLSRLLFRWLLPLFSQVKYHDLEEKDLYNVLPEDLSRKLGDRLERYWNTETSTPGNEQPKFLKALIQTLDWSHLKYSLQVFLLNVVVRVTQPLILANMIFHSNVNPANWKFCLNVMFFIVLMVLQIFLSHHADYGLKVLGMRLRIACSSLIHRKMLRLSCGSIKKFVDTGFMVNLHSKYVVKLDNVFVAFDHVWTIPLQAVVVTYFMWQRIGLVAIFGIGFMAATTIPTHFLPCKITTKLADIGDKRMLMLNQLISNIRTVKMFVWEKPVGKLASKLRSKEVKAIKVYSYLKAACTVSPMFANPATLFVSILLHCVLQSNGINAIDLYVVVYYYYQLRITLCDEFPLAVKILAEARASVTCIQNFLILNEVDKTGDVCITNSNEKWSDNSTSTSMRDIYISTENVCSGKDKGDEEEAQETSKFVGCKSAIDRSLYWKYLTASGSYMLIFLTVVCFVLAQSILSGSSVWLAYWTRDTNFTSNKFISDNTSEDDFRELWILGSLTSLGIIISLLANILLLKICLRANEKIHEATLTRLLAAPMRVFDDNPTERILGWFSNDSDVILPVTLLQTIQWCSIVVGNTVQVLIVNWLTLLPIVALLFLFKKVNDICLKTIRNLKRLEAVD